MKKTAKRRGPKTPAGKLTISTNAKTHGITSPRPVVTHFESEGAWKEYRQSIIDSLAPEGGIEQALAERVALTSWRLNRVIAFETEKIQKKQDHVIADMENRASASFYGTRSNLSPRALEEAQQTVDAVALLFDSNSADEIIERFPAAEWVFDTVVDEAVEFPREDGEEAEEALMDTQVNVIFERLEERVGDKQSFTATGLREIVYWVAEQANVPEARNPDGQVVYSPGEGLLERLYTMARALLERAKEEHEKIEGEIVDWRRERMLPTADEMQKITRYEAHLSREMYRALHELEALQTRRDGGSAPLGRLDVQST